MKKIYLIVAAVLTSATLSAQQYDLQIALTTPVSGSSVVGASSTNVAFTLTNNGPLTISAGDTLWFSYALEANIFGLDGTPNGVNGVILPQDMVSGASIPSLALGGLSINLGSITVNTEVCVVCWGVNGAVDLGKDPNDSDVTNNVDCFTATPPANVGLTENSIVTSVYPNPATDVLNIVTNEEIANVSIISLEGKVVATATNSAVDISMLNSGIYIYEVTTTNGNVARDAFMKK